MSKNTVFRSDWLLKLDSTDRVCLRWLIKEKTSTSFKVIVCKTDDLKCATVGWADIKKNIMNDQNIFNV